MENNITVSSIHYDFDNNGITLNLEGQFINLNDADNFSRELNKKGKITTIGISRNLGFKISENQFN